ncbi:MAG: ABC transporter transmembrane domain-containing protein, partial [Microbacteriaceae bacterium]
MSSPRHRGPFGRSQVRYDGPKAKFSDLLPYLREHRGILSVVIVLSVIGAGASLAQPLLVSQVINAVQAGTELGWLVPALIGLVVGGALLTSFRHYLLQRTGESVVLSARRHLVSRLLNLPISEFDARRTGDLVSRVGADTTTPRAVLTQGLVEEGGGGVTFVGAILA